MLLKGKHITICVTGGIAVYKAVSLCSLLIKKEAIVHVIMTRNATEFVTPLTFKTITKEKVIIDMFDSSEFVPHISIAELSDLIVVAPATANSIAKFAHGIADDMVSTVMLSAKVPKIIVPAMNTAMYENPITIANIEILKKVGFTIIEPGFGRMACGTIGAGRFPEIETIYSSILSTLTPKNAFFDKKKCVITAGGTIEDIDPVRYISNRSSGKTAFALAESLICLGADVTLIAANVSELLLDILIKNYPKIDVQRVRSASDMKKAVDISMGYSDVLIMAAAVADYKVNYSEEKMKKSFSNPELLLTKTEDILGSFNKRPKQFVIGFAAETNKLEEYAKQKLVTKKADCIIANIVSGEKNAIGADFSEFFLYFNDGTSENIPYDDKNVNSYKVLDLIGNYLHSKDN